MTSLRAPGITGFLAVLLGFALLLAVAAGRYPVAMMQLLDALFAGPPDSNAERFGAQNLVWQLRGPRVLVAALVGAALAASGAAMQSVFRNPLAAPDLLGVSAGAALGAARLAWLADGGDEATVCREPELKCEHLPRAAEAGGLDERLRRFRALYTAVQPHYAPLPHATTQAAAQGAN